jgi:hypothetical protein
VTAVEQESDAPVRRPDPVHWVWYAVGGRLPGRYRAWILRDATGPRWMLRHGVRALVQLAVPVALVMTLLPGLLSIRVFASVCGMLIGVFFALAYSTESVEHRVRRAGFRPGLAEAIRQRAAQEREAVASVRRHEANARRAARRGWTPPD